MHKLKPLTLVMIRDHFREFETVFWTILFPTLILILFVGVFGQMFSEEGVDPSLSYGVYYEETTHGMTDGILRGLFTEIGDSGEFSFTFTIVEEEEDGRDLLRNRDIDALLVFTEGFSELNQLFMGPGGEFDPVTLRIVHSGRSESVIARDIFESIIEEVEMSLYGQLHGGIPSVEFSEVALEEGDRGPFVYENFIFPSAIMLSILTVSFFNMPITIVDYAERGVMKKIRGTPARGVHYFFAFLISQLLVLIIALILLYIASLWIAVSPLIYGWRFILYTLYATVTALSFGLLFSSFFRKTASLASVANIFFFLTMFLSGLYFDVQVIPGILRWYSRINPATHLVDGLRSILIEGPMPAESLWVPAVWFLCSLGVFLINQKKVLRYE